MLWQSYTASYEGVICTYVHIATCGIHARAGDVLIASGSIWPETDILDTHLRQDPGAYMTPRMTLGMGRSRMAQSKPLPTPLRPRRRSPDHGDYFFSILRYRTSPSAVPSTRCQCECPTVNRSDRWGYTLVTDDPCSALLRVLPRRFISGLQELYAIKQVESFILDLALDRLKALTWISVSSRRGYRGLSFDPIISDHSSSIF